MKWYLNIWSPNGAGPARAEAEETGISSSGMRLQLSPEGDCIEGVFEANGSMLLAKPLDCIQFVVDGKPLFYGEVRIGGNVSDPGLQKFVLRSLTHRLKEVTIPVDWTAPKQAAHKTLRSLLAAVIPSTKGCILYDENLIEELPFDCREIVNAHQQNPIALLEQIKADGAAMRVEIAYGVRPDRYFFVKQRRWDSYTPQAKYIHTTWQTISAQTPVTAVLWFVAKRSDGSWLTHLSESYEAQVYGRRVKAVSLSSNEGLWETARGRYELRDKTGRKDIDSEKIDYFQRGIKETRSLNTPIAGDILGLGAALAVIWEASRWLYLQTHVGKGWVEFVYHPHEVVDRYLLDVSGVSGKIEETSETSKGENISTVWLSLPGKGKDSLRRREMNNMSIFYPAEEENMSGVQMSVYPEEGHNVALLAVKKFIPQTINRKLLDRLATYHYRIPAGAPAEIEVDEILRPEQFCRTIVWSGGQGVVSAYEYRISAERGFLMAVYTEQREDAEQQAMAELIKQRDNAAVIRALTAGT